MPKNDEKHAASSSDACGEYSGSIVDGKKSGQGIMKFSNGDVYDGNWKNDVFDGLGMLYLEENKSTYEGDFKKGLRHGIGRMTFEDGSFYDGNWSNGVINGFAKFFQQGGSGRMGATYEGEWLDGNFHGNGSLVFDDGSKYEGSWVEGKRQGFGIHTNPDGSRIEGEWLQDEPLEDISAADMETALQQLKDEFEDLMAADDDLLSEDISPKKGQKPKSK